MVATIPPFCVCVGLMDIMTQDADLQEAIDDGLVSDLLPVQQLGEPDSFWSQFEELKNPYLKDPEFKRRQVKTEAPVHKAAFLYWMQLAGSHRTDRAVATKYDVTAAMVGKWRKSFNWQGRYELLLKEDAEEAVEVARRTLRDDLNNLLTACDAGIRLFKEQVKSGAVEITAKDFVLLSQEIRSIRRELEDDSDRGALNESGNSLDKIAALADKLGATGRDVLVQALSVQVAGGRKISHEASLEAATAKDIQDKVDLSEIGESEDDDVEFNHEVSWSDDDK